MMIDIEREKRIVLYNSIHVRYDTHSETVAMTMTEAISQSQF